jgi:hypothetical protein
MAQGDGRSGKGLTALAKTDVLMLEDWGLAPLREGHRRDLRESVDDRHERRATLVLSQLPVEHWHEALGDPPLADALLDCLMHNAYKSTLQGESRRKRQARLTRGAITEEYSTAQRRCAPSLAGCAWRGWQPCRGPRGRLPVDWVADIRGICRR